MQKENIKNLTTLNSANFIENDQDKIKDDILKNIDNYDYINIETTFNLLDYINKENKNICVINLSENKYFCSNKYCLIKEKLYRYDKIKLTTHLGDDYVSYSFIAKNKNHFIKFCSKKELISFYEETIREIKFLEKHKNSKIDFINRQKLLDYDIKDEYVISARKLINGRFINKKTIIKASYKKKLFIIEETLKQLALLEKNGVIYNDLSLENVIFDETNITLIDLGSYQNKHSKIKYLYNLNRSDDTYNIYELTLIFIYNIFNILNDKLGRNKLSQEKLEKITNIYNYSPNVTSLITNIIRLKYKSSCTFKDIFNIIENYKKNQNKINNTKIKITKSNLKNLNYIDAVCKVKEQEIKNIIDIQYSDCDNDIKNSTILKNKEIKYTKICQDDKIITKNRFIFNQDTNKTFTKLDILKEPIPNTDIIFCIDLFENLTIDQIWTVIENIKHSKSKYFAVNYYGNNINKDSIKSSNNKYIDLTMPPFNFPSPYFIIPVENDTNYIAIYDIKEVDFFMKYHDEFMSNIRSNIYKYLKNRSDKLINAFSKDENNIKLLKEALFANSLDWDLFYYDKRYKDIVDNNEVFDEYINLLLLIYSSDIERFKKDNKNISIFEELNNENYPRFSLIAKEFTTWYFNKLNI